MIDYKRVIKESNAHCVAEAIGVKMQYSSTNTLIICPGHEKHMGHPDKNFGSCMLTKHGYYCFAAQKSVDVITMVQEQAALNGEDMSYSDAARFIIKTCHLNDVETNDNSKPIEKLPFSVDELKSIGIDKYPKMDNIMTGTKIRDCDEKSIYLYSQTNVPDISYEQYLRNTEWIIYNNMSWDELYRQNKSLCLNIILKNANLAKQKAVSCLNKIKNEPYSFIQINTDVNYELLLKSLEEHVKNANKIINKTKYFIKNGGNKNVYDN